MSEATDLFATSQDNHSEDIKEKKILRQPLADRMRPKRLDDVWGQDHLLAEDGLIRMMLDGNHLSSLILWGGPGCGKTTIARLLANEIGINFIQVSAIFSGVAELKKIFAQAEKNYEITGKGTLLFVDEIHRFNRSQQDSFLPYVENGTVILVGATTENPSFALNSALLSRCQVAVLNRLDNHALNKILVDAEQYLESPLPLNIEAKNALIAMADGDGRYLLNMIEQIFSVLKSRHSRKKEMTVNDLSLFLSKKPVLYDKDRDEHYNLISALHKSMRGSDPDAALYWFARMLEGGEDPRYIARRLVRFASEDVGEADPTSLPLAQAASQAYERLGSPEGELALAQLIVHLSVASKSNAVYVAYKKARALAKKTGSLIPPAHIRNAPTKMMHDLGYGKGYMYDHNEEDAFSGQNYFPDGLERETLYEPVRRGFEERIFQRLENLKARRLEIQKKNYKSKEKS